MGFVERLDVGNQRGIKKYNKATRRMKLPLIKHALWGWGELCELIFRHVFNLKCLLNVQVEKSGRKLTMSLEIREEIQSRAVHLAAY